MTLLQTSDNRRPVTETAERFLRAIVDQLSIERVGELHLFTALRQGVYETGVAVIAAWPEHAPRIEGTRHTVYTARYRRVVKGPDRGRWEFECVAEADVPLITVETVVRGVQRRSGDLDDPVRYDEESLAHVLHLAPSPAPSPVPSPQDASDATDRNDATASEVATDTANVSDKV